MGVLPKYYNKKKKKYYLLNLTKNLISLKNKFKILKI